MVYVCNIIFWFFISFFKIGAKRGDFLQKIQIKEHGKVQPNLAV